MKISAMKPISEFIKSTIVGRLLVILPLGLLVMIVMKIIEMLKHLETPIVEWLPGGLHFPTVIVSVLLLLLCFIAGLIGQTHMGQDTMNSFEHTVLNHIPGYSILRSFTRRIGNVEESEKFAPALVEIEQALVPAFVVEEHADARYTVFVPSSPTPGVGAIYIMAKDRVHLLDVTFLKTIKCVSRWGVGSGELMKVMNSPEKARQ
ncbi:MAG TPA: DUF502 domain-containing protein [Pyrinomonadaceae bacterium]|jgi:uncharacterized membrane protein